MDLVRQEVGLPLNAIEQSLVKQATTIGGAGQESDAAESEVLHWVRS